MEKEVGERGESEGGERGEGREGGREGMGGEEREGGKGREGKEGRGGEEGEGREREGREGRGRRNGGGYLQINLTLSGLQSMLEMGCDASVTFCSNDTEPITPSFRPLSSFFTLLSG